MRCNRLLLRLVECNKSRDAVWQRHHRYCELAVDIWRSYPQILLQTQAITLTLLFRSVGAVLFGIISDRYGRKYPLILNLLVVSVLELGAGFVQTYAQFLAVRSLFGIGMGGIWGLAASTALENLPVETRGLASGVLQQGYAVGYLIAAVINLTLVPEQSHSWRALFWCAAGISAFAACIRLCLPESKIFLQAREDAKHREEERLGHKNSGVKKTQIFFRETGKMLKHHWMLCIYAVLLMTGMFLERIFAVVRSFLNLLFMSFTTLPIGFNFLSHGSQVIIINPHASFIPFPTPAPPLITRSIFVKLYTTALNPGSVLLFRSFPVVSFSLITFSPLNFIVKSSLVSGWRDLELKIFELLAHSSHTRCFSRTSSRPTFKLPKAFPHTMQQ